MSDNDFRNKHQELEHLFQELKQTKDLMRDISVKMSQIERHVKRAFIPLETPKRNRRNSDAPKRERRYEQPTINEIQALAIFDDLKSLLNADRGDEVSERLEKMAAPDLRVVAHEVGLTFASKPSKRLLVSRIRSRVNESILLSTNVNVTEPRSASLERASSLDELAKPDVLQDKS
jgi:hypothetical protein